MVRTAIIAASLLVVGASPANAQEMWTREFKDTGLWLTDVCRSTETTDSLLCIGYIRGMNAGHEFTAGWVEERRAFCRGPAVSIEQQKRVLIKYADDHPEQLDIPISLFAFAAFTKAFPCQRQN